MKRVAPKRTAALLNKAREVMNSRGRHWMRGELERNGQFCSIGGLNKAAGSPQRYADDYKVKPLTATEREARFVLAEAITGERPASIIKAEIIIMGFNDDASQWSAVSRMFRKAAKLAVST